MVLVRLLPRARGQGEHRPKHSGFPLCKLCPNISFASSTISGRVEGQDLNPCNLPMKPSLIHMHASLGWESPVCLTPSNKTVMGWLSYATQVGASRQLPGMWQDKRQTDAVSGTADSSPVVSSLLSCLVPPITESFSGDIIFLPRGIISSFDPKSTLRCEIACWDPGLNSTAIQVWFGQIISLLPFPQLKNEVVNGADLVRVSQG